MSEQVSHDRLDSSLPDVFCSEPNHKAKVSHDHLDSYVTDLRRNHSKNHVPVWLLDFHSSAQTKKILLTRVKPPLCAAIPSISSVMSWAVLEQKIISHAE